MRRGLRLGSAALGALVIAVTVASLVLSDGLPPPPSPVVEFPDPGLEAAVREAIGKPTGDIYELDLLMLTELDADNQGIADLTGLEHCRNLTTLSLAGNSVSNLAPLSGLAELVNLNLFWTYDLRDIDALGSLFNLQELDISMTSVDSLSAIVGCVSLQRLRADMLPPASGSIGDLTPLLGLVGLRDLSLQYQSVEDISSLVGHPGFGSGDSIDLTGNRLCLYPGSSDQADLDALLARGVDVSYGDQDCASSCLVTVEFPDPTLEEVVREAIGKPSGEICESDLLELEELDALGRRSIADLTGLEHCVSLRTLNLGDNAIEDLSPLAYLTEITDLRLHWNRISDLAPIAGLTKLSSLWLHGNSINDLTALASLTHLRHLSLGWNSITDISPIAGLTQIEGLELNDNPALYNIGAVGGMHALEGLYIYNTGYVSSAEAESLSVLVGCASLRILYAGMRNGVSGGVRDLSVLAGMAGLRLVSIPYQSVEDITPLVANQGLSLGDEIDLTGNKLCLYPGSSDQADLDALLARGVDVSYSDQDCASSCLVTVEFPDPALEEAIREAIGKWSGDICEADVAPLTTLEVSSLGIRELVGLEYCVNLEQFYAGWNQIVDVGPLSGLSRLRKLDLRSNPGLSDITELRSLSSLEWLIIDETDVDDLSPLSTCSNLQHLFANSLLPSGPISDLSPLSGLVNLVNVNLENQSIEDIGALVDNPGLGLYDTVDLRGNRLCLYAGSTDQEDVDTLLARGVHLYSDNQTCTECEEAFVPDPALAAALRAALGKSDDAPLCRADLAGLDELAARGCAIGDLTGLEWCVNLRSLALSANRISDLEPLRNLANLTGLDVDGCQITDIAPLAEMSNLQILMAGSNQIADISALPRPSRGWFHLALHDNRIADISSLSDAHFERSGFGLSLQRNYLDVTCPDSPARRVIQTLEDRGVAVAWLPQNGSAPEPDALAPQNPVLGSPTHTVGVASSDRSIVIEANGAYDNCSVAGFEFAWDQDSTWTPTQIVMVDEEWDGSVFEALSTGDWYFHLATVDNSGNWSEPETLGPIVICDPMHPPIATAGPDLSCTSGELVLIQGSGSDSDQDEITEYSWSQVDGPEVVLIGDREAQVGFYAPTAPNGSETLALNLVVTDSTGLKSEPDEVEIEVTDPNADVTPPIIPTVRSSTHTVNVPSSDASVSITVTGSTDSGSGLAGFEYAWDRNASWTPTETKMVGSEWTGEAFSIPFAGNWYFHVAAVDEATNWSQAVHFGPVVFWPDGSGFPDVLTSPAVAYALVNSILRDYSEWDSCTLSEALEEMISTDKLQIGIDVVVLAVMWPLGIPETLELVNVGGFVVGVYDNLVSIQAHKRAITQVGDTADIPVRQNQTSERLSCNFDPAYRILLEVVDLWNWQAHFSLPGLPGGRPTDYYDYVTFLPPLRPSRFDYYSLRVPTLWTYPLRDEAWAYLYERSPAVRRVADAFYNDSNPLPNDGTWVDRFAFTDEFVDSLQVQAGVFEEYIKIAIEESRLILESAEGEPIPPGVTWSAAPERDSQAENAVDRLFKISVWDADGDLATLEARLDSAALETTELSGTTRDLEWRHTFSPGTYTLEFVACDEAGNCSSRSEEVHVQGVDLVVVPDAVSFEDLSEHRTVTVYNTGIAGGVWHLARAEGSDWIEADVVGGSLAPGESATVTLTVLTAKLVVGMNSTQLEFTSEDQIVTVDVQAYRANEAPVARREMPEGRDVTVTVGSEVTTAFYAKLTDVDGNLSRYRWLVRDSNGDYVYSGSWEEVSGGSTTVSHAPFFSVAGSYTVEVEVQDEEEAEDTTTWLVDVQQVTYTAPVITSYGPMSAETSRDTTIYASVEDGDEDLSWIEFFVDGDLVEGGSYAVSAEGMYSCTYAFAEAGDHTAAVSVVDAAGNSDYIPWNISATSPVSFPAIVRSLPEGLYTYWSPDAQVNLSAIATDADGDLASVAWDIDYGNDREFEVWHEYQTISGSSANVSCPYTIDFGNSSTVFVRVYVFDKGHRQSYTQWYLFAPSE